VKSIFIEQHFKPQNLTQSYGLNITVLWQILRNLNCI